MLLRLIIGCFIVLTYYSSVSAYADTSHEEFRQKFLTNNITWDDVLKKAKEEKTVHFYYWGGDDQLNFWIDTIVKKDMKKFGIDVIPRHLASTKDAVDLALTEKQSGKGLGKGSVDILWVNGENFFTLSQQDLLFGSFAQKLPNSDLFDWNENNPAAVLNLRDFGFQTLEREIPWSGEQYICTAERTRLPAKKTPTDFKELNAWLKKNPGRFTYVKPPHYLGNTFVQQTLYAFSPDGKGYESFQKPLSSFTAKEFATLIKPGMVYLRELAPLLNGGKDGSPKYPEDAPSLNTLMKNGEIDMVCQFGLYFVSVNRDRGELSDTSEAVIFPKNNMIKNKNYLAILGNAPHPAAALVLANYMSSVKAQKDKLEISGFPPGIDPWKLSKIQRDELTSVTPPLYGVTQQMLDENIAPDTNSSLVGIIKEVWIDYVEKASTKSFESIVEEKYQASAK